MPDHDDTNPYHLPGPSSQPLLASLGAALMLAGLVPDARIWRFSIISAGATILAIAVWLWVSDAIEEYNDLPDD